MRRQAHIKNIPGEFFILPGDIFTYSSQSKVFTIKQLENTLNEILSLDKQIKTTSNDEKVLMEMLLIGICNNI